MFFRRFRISGAVFLAGLLFAAAVTAESETITITAGDYELQQNNSGKYSITMLEPGFTAMQSPGDPALPQKIIDITVPADFDLSDLTLTIDHVETTDLSGIYELLPQPPFKSNSSEYWGSDKVISDGKNMKIYGRNELFPQQCAVVLPYTINKEVNTGSAQGAFILVKHIRIVFVPFQYNPVDGRLIFVSEATVTVSYNNRESSAVAPASASTAAPAAIKDYVIITTNAIVSNSTSLSHFVTMKERQGHDVAIVTETDFDGLTGQAPNGRAEKIRKWLQDNYVAMGIDYVLLIGNPDPDDPLDPSDPVGDIPMKMCYPHFYEPEDRESPTDFFYADLVGNWDVDGDQIYGVEASASNSGRPHPDIDPTTFSVRWTGKIKFDYAEEYTFYGFSDDGFRMWIDGNLIINNWTDHAPETATGTITPVPGVYPITIEYYQNTGHAVVNVQWACPPYIPRFFMAMDHLYFWDTFTSSYVSGGLNKTYYNNMDFTGLERSDLDGQIIDVWSTGDNDPVNGRKTGSQVFVGRIPVYNDDYEALDAILDKTIQYESDDPTAISWRKSILLPQNELTSGIPNYKLGEGIKNDVADPAGFSSFRIYMNDYSGVSGPTPDAWPCSFDLVKEKWINTPDSRGMVTWNAHGSQIGAASIFNSGIAPELDNTKPSFTFQASCLNGYPEDDNNLAYTLLRHGAVATVAASRVSWGGSNTDPDQPTNSMNACIAYAYTKHVISSGKPAGEAVSAFKAPLPEVDMNVMDYNLYGDPDCRLLTVYHNQPPLADAGGPYFGNQGFGTKITLDGSASSDPEGDALEYRWDYDNDGNYDTQWSSSPILELGRCGVATLDVTLQVRDAGGVTGTATTQATFLNVNPVADAGSDQTADEGSDVAFSGSFTDPGCDSHLYTWYFGDLLGTSGTLTPVHAYGDNGTYTTELTVIDNHGGSGTDAVTVTVNNVAPTVSIDAVTPATVMVGQPVTFQGSFSDPGWLDTHTSNWNFGDGTSASGTLTEENDQPDATGSTQVTKTYATAGTFTVTLTITDDDGSTGTATVSVTVIGFNFTVSPNPVSQSSPVTVSYTIPAMYNGATIRIIEHHSWYTEYRTEFNQIPLSGITGNHSYADIWFWNKWYFGTTSGPYLIELEVNGSVVESLQLSFSY